MKLGDSFNIKYILYLSIYNIFLIFRDNKTKNKKQKKGRTEIVVAAFPEINFNVYYDVAMCDVA